MEVSVLGPLRVVDGGGREVPVNGARLRSLLVLLASRPGAPVPVAHLVDRLWGDEPPAGVANALQALVSKLRRALGAAAVVTSPGGYALAVPPEAVDAHRFERLAEDGRALLAVGEAGTAARVLADALALWRGPALADLVEAQGAVPAATRLEELRATAVEDRFDAELALGHHAAAVAEIEAAVAGSPYRERLRAQHLLALYRCGRQADALQAYQDARRVLGEELGLEPGPELRRLEQAVLAQDPALDPPAAPTSAAGPATAVDGAPPTNLRPPLTAFVGREDDLARLADLVGGQRLVTLVGPGGVGKTRLGVEAALRHRSAFPGGAWFVGLESVTAGNAALAVSDAVGLSLMDAVGPTSAAGVADRLRALLDDRAALVVLDNCEHLVDEAAGLAEALLSGAGRLHVLATSREPLRVPGEVVFAVPPLDRDDAVTLFADRAVAASRNLEWGEEAARVAAGLCERLDGLPLAIELAAARTRAFTLEQLTRRLDDRFGLLTGGARTAAARQQTLRAVVDWSYDLLFDDERRVFERLAVFADGCTLEAAEAVCGDDDLAPADVGEIVARLVDKSLVVADGTGRFRLLATLAEYGRERLAARGGLDDARCRHARYLVGLVEVEMTLLDPPAQRRWSDDVRAELDDLRAAMGWAVQAADAELALVLAGRLGWFWWYAGMHGEALPWLEAALAVPGDVRPRVRARALAWASAFGMVAGDTEVSRRRAVEAVEVGRLDVEPTWFAAVCMIVAWVHLRASEADLAAERCREAERTFALLADERADGFRHVAACGAAMACGDYDDAAAHAALAVEAARRRGDPWATSMAMERWGEALDAAGRHAEAAGVVDEARRLMASLGMRGQDCMLTARLADLVDLAGDRDRAQALYQEALAVARTVAAPMGEAFALNGMGIAYRLAGRLDAARAAHDAALAIYERVGSRGGRGATASYLGLLATATGDLDGAERWHLAGLDDATAVNDPESVALALEGLADVAAARGDGEAAARLLGRSAGTRASCAVPRPARIRRDADRVRAAVGALVGDRYDALAADGAATPLDALVRPELAAAR
ncbi:MAG TPA: BTAD domain-containing putative transcriptional regulator [Acidimicrobiales bacterium]